MTHMYGLTGIQARAFEVQHEDMSAVNEFLREYDGNVIDIQTAPMALGVTKIIVTYKAAEG